MFARFGRRAAFADANRQSADLVDKGEASLVGEIVAVKHWRASAERRLRHHCLDGAALVEGGGLQFDDELALLHGDIVARRKAMHEGQDVARKIGPRAE